MRFVMIPESFVCSIGCPLPSKLIHYNGILKVVPIACAPTPCTLTTSCNWSGEWLSIYYIATSPCFWRNDWTLVLLILEMTLLSFVFLTSVHTIHCYTELWKHSGSPGTNCHQKYTGSVRRTDTSQQQTRPYMVPTLESSNVTLQHKSLEVNFCYFSSCLLITAASSLQSSIPSSIQPGADGHCWRVETELQKWKISIETACMSS